jgi:hypothetical protein
MGLSQHNAQGKPYDKPKHTLFQVFLYHSTFTIQHKLNYFLFCQTFEKIFIICAKILINLKVQLSRFESQTFHDDDLKLQ